jgi:hypothetical protein
MGNEREFKGIFRDAKKTWPFQTRSLLFEFPGMLIFGNHSYKTARRIVDKSFSHPPDFIFKQLPVLTIGLGSSWPSC